MSDSAQNQGYDFAVKAMADKNNPYCPKTQPADHKAWYVGFTSSVLLAAGCLNITEQVDPICWPCHVNT